MSPGGRPVAIDLLLELIRGDTHDESPPIWVPSIFLMPLSSLFNIAVPGGDYQLKCLDSRQALQLRTPIRIYTGGNAILPYTLIINMSPSYFPAQN
jgi:hypothetical protein